MAVFFSADPHFGHANIIKYSNRPFAAAPEMDQAIIDRWNERIAPGDTLYCLGDWCLWRGSKPIDQVAASYRERLNCRRIIFVWGNHDQAGRGNEGFCRLFESTHDLLEIKVAGQRLVLCHYALRVWNKSHHGSFHLYGHSHGSLPDDPAARAFDCGVDCFGFYPVSMDEVVQIMAKKQWQPVDHHGRGNDGMTE